MTTAAPRKRRTRKLKPGEAPPPLEALVSTTIQKSTCGRCGKPVMIGYVRGVKTKLDPMWLNVGGELFALVSGLKTYQTQLGGGGKVFKRRPYHIEAGIPRWGKIIAEHRCETRWPAGVFDIPERKESSDACPF